MRAGRMRRNIKPVAVAAEFLGVAPGPGQRAAHLFVHRHQVAVRLLDIDEVEDHGVRAGAHQRLGQRVIIRPLVAPPRAAVDENVDRCVWFVGAENIQPLIFARPVGDALRRAEDRARPLRRRNPARHDQRPVRRVDILIVGVVERLLVHVAPDKRAFSRAFVALRIFVSSFDA